MELGAYKPESSSEQTVTKSALPGTTTASNTSRSSGSFDATSKVLAGFRSARLRVPWVRRVASQSEIFTSFSLPVTRRRRRCYQHFPRPGRVVIFTPVSSPLAPGLFVVGVLLRHGWPDLFTVFFFFLFLFVRESGETDNSIRLLA